MTSKGYWRKGKRAKEGAFETIDNVTKFALAPDDYEEFEEWVDYTPDEMARMEEAERKTAFEKTAPERMKTTELTIEDILDAIAELGVFMASK